MKYKIYQLSNIRETEYGFMEYIFAEKHGFKANDYDLVYESEIDSEYPLEALYEIFNIRRPEDFEGHSLSVSDVVGIEEANGWQYYYCDSFGWTIVTEYFR